VNALGVLLTSLLALALLAGPPRVALWALVTGILYLPQQQSIEVLGTSLTALRLLEVTALLRLLLRAEWRSVTLHRLDFWFAATYLYAMGVFLLRSDLGQTEVIGRSLDALICYAMFRVAIRTVDDFAHMLKALAWTMVPYVGLLVIEVTSGRNPFAQLGAWSSWVELRGDRVRAMGSFRNPSLLGTLGACFLPLYLALMRRQGTAFSGALGATLCVGIVYLSNSGGPTAAAVLGVVAFAGWSIRRAMGGLRALAVLGLIGLALVMKAPIWALLERASAVTGGSGWHRAHLLTMAWTEIDRWWRTGMPLADTVHWFPYVLGITGTADITNTFLDYGLRAGLPAMLLLIVLLWSGFRRIGRTVTALSAPAQRSDALLLWGLGCALWVHVVTWFGITYFDQTFSLWTLHIAATAALTQLRPAAAPSATQTEAVRTRDRPSAWVTYPSYGAGDEVSHAR